MMQLVRKIDEIKAAARGAAREGKSVGLVPTMGYLHEGHISLMKKARAENDFLAVSIFVNPTQFGPSEDLDSYPRDLERDLRLCEEAGVNIVFAPESSEMYPEGYSTYVTVEGGVTAGLCGKSRPIHFRGVATVVTKLFNIVRPERAYFGQKDAQQVAVIKKMVRDTNQDVQVIACPIVREADGLALSSRNTYLSPSERQDALTLSSSLFGAVGLISSGEKSAAAVRGYIESRFAGIESASIDYIEIVDPDTMEPLSLISNRALIAIAVKIGKTRLIDNIVAEV
ncbi:pantothenate synthetase PanC [Peptoclostridium acidaminophilum DSM 3953]|uniref:Pantothenate synthetase n=2 Tax=Peptoclostridium acidaminophilum TaxID=1731 RepID=W8TER2_PEPAC|nr:pantoate--beta-alanine ligase [Peptoclostridium acidaminophilum]AHM56313.1 pantothenate synthetase PanC [Peptoclostridium acidaminophilum DSM 3953]